MEIKTLVDAGPLIGWLNADDQWHEWSVSVLSARRGPLHTTEIVLGEACWHLAGTQQIMLKYPVMDAADASLVSLAELAPKAALVTTDRRHFHPCRGLRNRALKLILPE